MPQITKIYTKTGDDGTTGLISGARVLKDTLRIQCIGDVDELNSILGIVRTSLENTQHQDSVVLLAKLQNELFDLGAELATPAGFEWKGMIKVTAKLVKDLEDAIDEISAKIPPLKNFVLPGGTATNSYLHLARSVCRRAERNIITLNKAEEISPLVKQYVNRLSDLLFAMARYEVIRENKEEFLWKPGG